jgi:hypothetical protein
MKLLNYPLFLLVILDIISANNLKDFDQSLTESKLKQTIKHVYNKLQETQCTMDIKARPFIPGQDKGIYPSYIHVNIMDDTNSFTAKAIREYIKVPDMNMFVTSFVAYAILETYNYEGIKELDTESFNSALNQLLNFKDKNYDDVPFYTFWKQININGTWSQHPDNMCEIVNIMEYLMSDTMINIFESLGISSVANLLKLGKELREIFLYAYRIPADFDDTGVNLGLTGMVHKMRGVFGNSTHFWLEGNAKIKELFKEMKYLSYRPFDANSTDMNLIDPRSYFSLHEFLTERYALNKTDIMLPPTWVWEYSKQQKYFPIITMPFQVNNFDFNVASNFLFGLTNIVLFHSDQQYIQEAFDDDMMIMYKSTLDLLVWAIKNDRMRKRPDLSLLYYPSIFDFYWLVTRTFSTLKNFNFENHPNKDFFTEVVNELENVLKSEGTEQIMSRINTSSDGSYFQELLGLHAGVNRGEDIVFATGLALNSLLNIWTTDETESGKILRIKYDTTHPNYAKYKINEINDDVVKYIINSFDSYLGPEVENVFFSGSVKNMASIASFFPANFNTYINGTIVEDPSDPKYLNDIDHLSTGMKGYVSEDEYKELLERKWYGEKAPVEEQYLNNAPFPYWASPSITYAINLLGLSKYKKLG